MHTVTNPPPASLPSRVSGSSVTVDVTVDNAVQPDNTVPATVSVEFDGETVSVPMTIGYAETVVPTATVEVDDSSGLDVTVGEARPSSIPNRYVIAVTLTVL